MSDSNSKPSINTNGHSNPRSLKGYETRLVRVEDSVIDLKKDLQESREESKDSFRTLGEALNRVANDNNIWREQQLKSRQTNWAVVITVIVGVLGFTFTVGVAGIGLLWMVVRMQEQGDTQPIKNDISALKVDFENNKRIVFDNSNQLTTIVAQNATSSKDRDDMRRDLYIIREGLDKTTLQSYGTVRDLQEVETQMKKAQDEFNLQHAHTERQLANFQNTFHEMNAIIPSSPSGPWYFPTVPDVRK